MAGMTPGSGLVAEPGFEVPPEVQDELEISLVDGIEEVLAIALEPRPS